LAYCSDFFERLFNNGEFQEKDMDEIPLTDIEPIEFYELLQVIDPRFQKPIDGWLIQKKVIF